MMDEIKRFLGISPPTPPPLPLAVRESFHRVISESISLTQEVKAIERNPDVFDDFVTAMRQGYTRNDPPRR